MNREKFGMIRDILKVIAKVTDAPPHQGATTYQVTHILRQQNNSTKKYLQHLASIEATTSDDEGDKPTWRLTPKGRVLLQKLNEFLTEYGEVSGGNPK